MAAATSIRHLSKPIRLIRNQPVLSIGKPTLCCNQLRKAHSVSGKSEYDVVIVGGGIVGLATAQEIQKQHPQLSLAVLEKESELSAHQTGHNSGVIHAGIYYTPGSMKAKLCVEGVELLYKYCDENNVPYKKCGKLIVALNEKEIPGLDQLLKRGKENGVKDLQVLDAKGIREMEPNCVGVKAVFSPHTGIIDYKVVTQTYGKYFEKHGGDVYTNFSVSKFDLTKESNTSSDDGLKYPVTIIGDESKDQIVKCRYVVTCCGLQSDKISALSGCHKEPRIVPFRGDYLLLKPERTDLVKANIYPVPDPRFPFLGVHFTPRMNGDVWLGPNAVLAFKREGYKLTDFNMGDTADAVSFRGLRKLAFRHLGFGVREMGRAFNVRAQVKMLQRYVPSLKYEDVTRGPSGVRAQALDRDGNLVDDFVFDIGQGDLGSRILHVRNAPSPAATSSLSIARMVSEKVDNTFSL